MLDLFFGGFTLGDIGQRAHIVADGFIVTGHRRHGEPFAVELAIFTSIPQFPLPRAGIVDMRPHFIVKRGVIAVAARQIHGLPNGFFGGIAGDGGKSLIDPQNNIAGIGDKNALLGFKSHSGNPQIFFGLAAFNRQLGQLGIAFNLGDIGV